jgi:hypothetical protein
LKGLVAYVPRERTREVVGKRKRERDNKSEGEVA